MRIIWICGNDAALIWNDSLEIPPKASLCRRILGAQDGHGTGQADALRANGRRAQNHGRRGVEKLRPMMFADSWLSPSASTTHAGLTRARSGQRSGAMVNR